MSQQKKGLKSGRTDRAPPPPSNPTFRTPTPAQFIDPNPYIHPPPPPPPPRPSAPSSRRRQDEGLFGQADEPSHARPHRGAPTSSSSAHALHTVTTAVETINLNAPVRPHGGTARRFDRYGELPEDAWLPPLDEEHDTPQSEQQRFNPYPNHPNPYSNNPPATGMGRASAAPLSALLASTGPHQPRRGASSSQPNAPSEKAKGSKSTSGTAHKTPSPPEQPKEVKRRKRKVESQTFEMRSPPTFHQMHPPPTSGLPKDVFQPRAVPDSPYAVPAASGPWSEQEDKELLRLKPLYTTKNKRGKYHTEWDDIAEKMKSTVRGFDRSGNACKLRFLNYLSKRPAE